MATRSVRAAVWLLTDPGAVLVPPVVSDRILRQCPFSEKSEIISAAPSPARSPKGDAVKGGALWRGGGGSASPREEPTVLFPALCLTLTWHMPSLTLSFPKCSVAANIPSTCEIWAPVSLGEKLME